MIQFANLGKKNKFGHNTFYLELERQFRIVIEETNNSTYILEFIQRGIFSDTTLFSFTSNASIFDAIEVAMDKVADYYRKSPKYNVPEHVYKTDKIEALRMARTYYKPIN